MRASIAILAILLVSSIAFADPESSDWPFSKTAHPGDLTALDSTPFRVPARWLEGKTGYEKAIQLQNETHVPILVWTTWNDSPACVRVLAYLESAKPKMMLRKYIRVVIDEHGKPEDSAFAKTQGLSGGNFYIVSPSSHTFTDSLWAWQPGVVRIIPPNLELTLASKLDAAK